MTASFVFDLFLICTCILNTNEETTLYCSVQINSINLILVTRRDNQMSYKNLKFPKGSTFLVTGGAGFIGSNLCEALLRMGYRVRCLDNLSTGRKENIMEFVETKGYEFIQWRYPDLDTVHACVGVDYVLHQAAWGSVPRSIEMPLLC